MGSILIGIFTLVLVIVCVLLVLVILMQRPNANAGMGSALGGGAVENIIGGEAGNVLTRLTVKFTVLFFVLSAGLYFGYIYLASHDEDAKPQTLSISSIGESKTDAKKSVAVPAKTEVAKPVAEKSATKTPEKPAAK